MDGEKEQTDDKNVLPPGSPGGGTGSSANKGKLLGPTDSSSGENAQHNREQKQRRRRRRHKNNRSSNRSYSVTFDNKDNNGENGKVGDSEAGHKKRRRHNRKHKPYHLRKYKPYTKLTWEERQERDEAESQRATRRRANRPTPYNTTQFLMEDHKAETPDLSSSRGNDPNDSSDELFEDDFRSGEYLERNFSAVYEEVQSERLQSMTKEQLVQEVFALSKRVTELEDSQRILRKEQENQKNDKEIDEKMQAKMDAIQKLQKEVDQLKEENINLKKDTEDSQMLTT